MHIPQHSRAILSVENLSKDFSDKTVVNNLSFDVFPGEIIALVGENGAGKSTTKNMLCGLLAPSSGEIRIEGQVVERVEGASHGISAVHQELSLFSTLSVAENICIHNLPGSALNVDWSQASLIAKQQLEFLGLDIDPDVAVESLGTGKQQIVEIAKALLHADKLLILDEPTTSLTAPEREKLFSVMRKLKEQGTAIIFISHFMDEIYALADKFIALRDGQQVGAGCLADVPRESLEEMMVGRKMGESDIDIGLPQSEEALRVEHLSSYEFHDVSFSLKKGEILGIAGLMGSGRTEVAEAIFGVRKATGQIFVYGEKIQQPTIAGMKELGLCYPKNSS